MIQGICILLSVSFNLFHMSKETDGKTGLLGRVGEFGANIARRGLKTAAKVPVVQQGLDSMRDRVQRFLDGVSKEELNALRTSLLVLEKAIGEVVNRINKVLGDEVNKENIEIEWRRFMWRLDTLLQRVESGEFKKNPKEDVETSKILTQEYFKGTSAEVAKRLRYDKVTIVSGIFDGIKKVLITGTHPSFFLKGVNKKSSWLKNEVYMPKLYHATRRFDKKACCWKNVDSYQLTTLLDALTLNISLTFLAGNTQDMQTE